MGKYTALYTYNSSSLHVLTVQIISQHNLMPVAFLKTSDRRTVRMPPATPNPLQFSFDQHPPPISRKTYPIAGILTTVYGLSELPKDITEVACLWLLHPRLQTQECMAPIAAHAITAWNKQRRSGTGTKGLIAVSFDARNHGTRLVDPVANEAWRQGNLRHAIDMYSCYQGTAADTSLLLTHLPSYTFPETKLPITSNIVYGISLGGHASWHCVTQDPRIGAAVVVIGTPDYTALMRQRAEKSKLKSWTDSDPKGEAFVGSVDFPPALVDAVNGSDPAAVLSLRDSLVGSGGPAVKARMRRLFKGKLAGKKLILLSGGADKLVPYKVGEPFLNYLKEAVGQGGFFADGDCSIDDLVFPGVGHELTPEMASKAQEWLFRYLEGTGAQRGVRVTSKL